MQAGYWSAIWAAWGSMKKPASRIILVVGLFAVACGFAAPALRAADTDAEKAAKKKQKEEAALKKYDKNGNGKLDPDEKAAMEADLKKARDAKQKKKEKEEGK